MAYTKGAFEIDAATGKAAVYLVDPVSPGDRAPFLSPLSNLTRLLWHSDLDYLEIFYAHTATLALPARSGGSGEVDYVLPAHNLGSVPFAALIVGGNHVDGAYLVQQTGSGERSLELVPNETGFTVVERWRGSLSAVNATIAVRALRVAPAIDTANAFLIDPANGVLQFGFGKFSTAGNAKLRLTTGAPAYWLPRIGPTMDGVGGGLRVVRPDGTFADLWGYSGNFTGQAGWGVVA